MNGEGFGDIMHAMLSVFRRFTCIAAALLALLIAAPAGPGDPGGEIPPGRRFAVGLLSHDFAGDFFRAVSPSEWSYMRHPKIEVRWEKVEPSQGRFDWSGIDRQLEALSSSGFDDLLMLVNLPVPPWARDASRGRLARKAPPADPEYWRRFVRELAGRYAEVVDFYEILNEPGWDVDSPAMQAYGSFHFGGQVETEYLEMLKAAYQEIKEADPDATVICGAMPCDVSGLPENGLWLLDVITDPEHQAQDWCDAFSLHPYYRPESWGYAYRLTRDLLYRKGIDKELYVTEIGWPHFSDKEDMPQGMEEQRRAIGAAGIGSLIASGCPRIWVYQDLDDPPGTDYEGLYYGLFDYQGNPLPAWYEFRGWCRFCDILNGLAEGLGSS